jgi:uncharacterized cupin superfamily protein
MQVVRFADAPAYTAPGHHDMQMVRLQGREAGPSTDVWLGVSRIAPGGGTTLSASPQEKMYVVLEGEVSISNGESEASLRAWDSCRIAASEPRRLENRTAQPAVVLLVMPLSDSERAKDLSINNR